MANPVDIGPCYHCKEPMWMTQSAYDTCRRNGQTFYCIHGHKQVFTAGPTEADTLDLREAPTVWHVRDGREIEHGLDAD
jgi:hypothetical protein